MNNEIKEMLDKIQNVVEHKEASYNGLIETKAEDYKQLLDYITNLQQENERLKELDKNYPIEEELAEAYRREEEYKSRCEKAVEYINENKHLSMFADCREPEEDWNYDLECSANDLLNILQNGSDSQ